MPEPMGRGQRYMPGLDGLRALAVLAVIADHLGLPWAPGGLLGVGVFFTLSGYLITDLLLAEWESTGRLQLANFWLRRARRLLPALFVMLAGVAVWGALVQPAQLAVLRGDVVAAALYISNWWLVFHHVSYFARFGPPSPLGHLWSLAVEEQFYLIWPLLLWSGLAWVRRRRAQQPWLPPRKPIAERRALVGVTLLLATLSAAEMALLYHPSFDPTRVYDGTDTRAFGLLVGAALAMVWPSRALTVNVTAGARRLVDLIGLVALIGIALLVWRTDQYSPFLYRGGLVLLSLATLLVVASAAHPASRLGRLLGCRPLRWIGVRSYGIYLWHYPVIVFTTPTVTKGVDLPRVVLQVGASIALAALSWRFIETPIRHGALGRFRDQLRASTRQGWLAVPASGWFALSAAVAGLALGCFGLAGIVPSAPPGSLNAGAGLGIEQISTSQRSPGGSSSSSTTRSGGSLGDPTGGAVGKHLKTATAGVTTSTSGALMTSCKSVVHLGDSTSESLISADYLPDPSQRLGAQYARVGVTDSIMEIQGATSIVETLPGEENAFDVASGLVSGGYKGCWVIALGTNDTADVYVGSNVSLATRIQRMMSLIGNEPVMWVNVVSLLDSGPYSESNMQLWNTALLNACARYPNMRIFDWASLAKPDWFISDGIHYSSAGSAVRAADIASALARAFPAGGAAHGPHSSCVVS